jgi:multiple sugar transport system permease protein
MTSTLLTPPAAPTTAASLGPARSPRGRFSLKRRRQLTGVLLALPAVLLLGTFFLWPLTRTVTMSFYDWPLLGVPEFTGLSNYVAAFSDNDFLSAVGFTLLYTVLATPLLLVVGLILALLVNRRTRAARIFQTVYFLPVVIGLASASFLWLFMFQSDIGPTTNLLATLGLLESSTNLFASYWSALSIVLVMVTWKVAGMQMLLLLSGLQSIPLEVTEAARIDDATRWQVIRHITLPLLRPTLALVLVFSVAGSLLAFDQFYILTTGGPANSTITAVYQIYRTSFIQFDLGYGAALSLLLMLVLGAVSAIQMLLLRNSDN